MIVKHYNSIFETISMSCKVSSICTYDGKRQKVKDGAYAEVSVKKKVLQIRACRFLNPRRACFFSIYLVFSFCPFLWELGLVYSKLM